MLFLNTITMLLVVVSSAKESIPTSHLRSLQTFPTSMPTQAPSNMPTFEKCEMSRDDRRAQTKDILFSVSDPVDLVTSGTPQKNALDWLLEEDGFDACPDDPYLVQRYVVAVFYFSTGGGSWTSCNAPNDFSDPDEIDAANAACNEASAWLSPDHECNWSYIDCFDDTPSMKQIDIEDNGLHGTLPSELKNLTHLWNLMAEEGSIEGTIPSEYGLLSNLRIIDLNFNQLTGTIHESFYFLSALEQLDLNDNRLSGTISPNIGNLTSLTFLNLENNQLTGSIPKALEDMNNLNVATFHGNMLTGTMPADACGIPGLTADCDASSEYYVQCAVDTCCSMCFTTCENSEHGASCEDDNNGNVCPESGLSVSGACDSCHGSSACIHSTGIVGFSSCWGGTDVCSNMDDAIIGDGSCIITSNGDAACEGLSGSSTVGDGSCFYRGSCQRAKAIIEDGSCKGSYACQDATSSSSTHLSIGAGSCNGNRACTGIQFNVGSGSCLGKKACCGVQYEVGANMCTSAGSCCDENNCPDGCSDV